MTPHRTSPFLILGVAFGASREESARGFARAVRRLRQIDNPPFDLEDLNWAQHEIDHREGDHHESLDDFRVPADPNAHRASLLDQRVIPPIERLPRRSPPTAPGVEQHLRDAAAATAVVAAVAAMLSSPSPSVLPASYSIQQEP